MTTTAILGVAWTALAALAAAGSHGAMAAPVPYAIDPTHTSVTVEVPHFNTSIQRLRWSRARGNITFDRAGGGAADGPAGSVEIDLDMASVSSGVPAFDSWLKGPEFFDTGRFPTARFVVERLVGAGGDLREAQGTLTLMGRSQPIVLKAQRFNCYTSPLFRREVCGGDFEATVQRSRFGLTAGLPGVSPDELRVLVQVEAIRQAP